MSLEIFPTVKELVPKKIYPGCHKIPNFSVTLSEVSLCHGPKEDSFDDYWQFIYFSIYIFFFYTFFLTHRKTRAKTRAFHIKIIFFIFQGERGERTGRARTVQERGKMRWGLRPLIFWSKAFIKCKGKFIFSKYSP